MTEETAAAPVAKRGFKVGGCLLRVGIAIVVLIAIVVAIGTIFDQGDSADQPVRGFDAGLASGFVNGDVTQFEAEHLFVVRLPSGDFLALYDKTTRQQELHGECRIRFDERALLGTIDPIPGMTGAFVEDCNDVRAVWRVDGVYSFGPGYGDLDRYGTSINADGHLIVDTSSRSCTRSRGVFGQPPFDVQRCGTGD